MTDEENKLKQQLEEYGLKVESVTIKDVIEDEDEEEGDCYACGGFDCIECGECHECEGPCEDVNESLRCIKCDGNPYCIYCDQCSWCDCKCPIGDE